MFCSKCGKQLPDGSSFCSACGAKLSVSKVNSAQTNKSPKSFQGSGTQQNAQNGAAGAQGSWQQYQWENSSANPQQAGMAPAGVNPGGKKKPPVKLIIIIAAAAVVLVIVLIAALSCGSRNSTYESDEIIEEDAEDEEDVVEETTTQEVQTASENLTFIREYDFSEGLAWVIFESADDDGSITNYFGVIDESGNMVFRYSYDDDTILVDLVEYSNGYAYIIYDNIYRVVDTEGNGCGNYGVSDDFTVEAYGDGYIVTCQYYGDFDTSTYTYYINPPDGGSADILLESEEEVSVKYCGKGVFQYGNELYFAETGTTVSPDFEIENLYFYEDTAAAGIDYYDEDETGYRGILHLIDSTGQITDVELTSDYGGKWRDAIVKNGYCVLYAYLNDLLAAYEISTGEFTVISETYTEQIIWDDIDGSPYFDETGRIALSLEGADGLAYVALFDTDWNMVSDTIEIDASGYDGVLSYTLSEGRLMVLEINGTVTNTNSADASVYDSDGNYLYSVNVMGYYSIRPYSEGAAAATAFDSSKWILGYGDSVPFVSCSSASCATYLDEDGNLLFDEVNTSNVIELEL